jgi:prepilin-type N-terminal cleavage/methylation domain-containing protein/prepilin-type processing-associated H-X9-DG protein
MTKSSPPRVQRAFTLIEMIVVLGCIGIMMAFTYPAYTTIAQRARATKDMNNLRQIATGTQMYMNDNSGIVFSIASSWMTQLNPKYISSWRVFQSPFDTRNSSEAGDGNTAVSFGINPNIWGQSADKITKPTTFIMFGPAQMSGATVRFQGAANTPPNQGITVLGIGSNTATSSPGGTAVGGTHNNRRNINALFADLHAETMLWSGTGPAFTNNAATATDPDGNHRWSLQ